MAYPSQSGPRRSVYNVPLAVEQPLQPLRAKYHNLELVDTSQTQTLGPMPVLAFLGEFLHMDTSLSTSGMRASTRAFNSVPEKADTPSGIYQPLMAAMNARTKHKARCPGFVFLNASERTPFPKKLGHMKPHICCYTTENSEMIQGSDPSLRTELGYAELFIEVKSHPSHDFFIDPPNATDSNNRASHDFFARSDTSVDTHRDRAFGQHLAYVAEVFAYQHRTFIFSISMSGSCARLLRWDRAGCVVTESFDVRKQPQLLCDFLWRFSHMPDAGRGHDPTVERASVEEEGIFVEAITRQVQIQLALDGAADGEKLERAVSEHYERGHVVAIHVLERRRISAKHPIRRFIVSRPVASSLRPTGKGTKGFWAVDPSTRSVVFLKDTWRLPPHGISEGDTIHLLRRNGVRNVPSVICYGDVPDFLPEMDYTFKPGQIQATMTDEFCGDIWVCKVRKQMVSLCKQLHYRIVLGTVGYGLKRFKGIKELLHATYDVFHALRDAVNSSRRLHRDISLGNILLVREGKAIRTGYLIDWDAVGLTSESGECVEEGRVGTWHFMSFRLLSSKGLLRRPTLQDDMESLLYVVLYCSLLWLPHNLSKDDLHFVISNMFEKRTWRLDHYYGGEGKMVNALDRQFTRPIMFKGPLHEWLQTVMDYHSPRAEGQYEGYWSNPDHLDSFWGEFLRTHALDDDDRMTHDHPSATSTYVLFNSSGRLFTTEDIRLPNPPSENIGAAVPALRKRKRRASTSHDASLPATKLRRSDRIKARSGDAART